ncbi:uncharacterized protein LOC112539438 [Tetranychus urticae]|uniref:Vitellogenin domain-containing protein n=1 Tax=Tetranychus urticae TaxID=32264 RepID=T1KV27_TETUR|nr:uncharacterized protein LOC112539438 [Tetranychus urticae]
MNSKILFAFVLAVNICIITATAKVYTYGVIVRTANKDFESHEGKLKLSVISNNTNKITQEDFELTPNDVEIMQANKYATTISSFAPPDKITSVYLRWTLSQPDNPYNAIEKPTVYFKSVNLNFFEFRQDPQWSPCTSYKFYPETIPIGIKHADGAIFNYYDEETTFKFYKQNVSVLDAEC